MSKDYTRLIAISKEVTLLSSCASLLHWDQEVVMPPKGAAHRADQLALLAGMAHERFTSPEVGGLISAVESGPAPGDPRSAKAVNIREMRRAYDKKTKLPKRLVEELARVTVLAHSAWVEARKNSDFKAFQPWLEKIIALKREQAACYGSRTLPYDALLDDYEPGETTKNVTRLFAALKKELVPLVRAVARSPRKPDTAILAREYPVDRQRLFGEMAAGMCGCDFSALRLDVSVHPFSTGIGPGDVRITTRYNPRFFNEAFFGVLHEMGHALYDGGLDPKHFGAPMGDTVSLAIHESQSRMWENFVGRGPAFWTCFFPKARAFFPNALGDVSLDAFVHAINDVKPSFIRVEADEATYNLHIILRFELEQALIAGDLAPKDVPAAWNTRFKELFGIAVPEDRLGCLQDTHWSGGAFGYFPTYCLGNLYAAQFFAQAKKDLPGLEDGFARGEFAPLLGWLRKNIHRHGMRYRAGELVKEVTGKPLEIRWLVDHLKHKYRSLYGT